MLLQPLAELGHLHTNDGVLRRVVVRPAAENLDSDLLFADRASRIGRFPMAKEQKQLTQTVRFSKRGTGRHPLYEKVSCVTRGTVCKAWPFIWISLFHESGLLHLLTQNAASPVDRTSPSATDARPLERLKRA
jgi:hypothetical protein